MDAGVDGSFLSVDFFSKGSVLFDNQLKRNFTQPILCCDSQIVWMITGMRVSTRARVYE